MTKEEINKKIFELQSDADIIKFVDERLSELETNSEEKTVGQNYTDSFQDYISQKVHYKATAKIKESDCPDLVYDDKTPYINLIKEIKKSGWYNELTLISTMFFIIDDYLPCDDVIGLDRYLTYASCKEKKISIQTISKRGAAFCSEKAGMAHNMFKFLGIDSEVVIGARETEMHAYNFIYPNGYGNEPMILYDPSFFVNFTKDNNAISFGFFEAFGKQDYEELKKGTPIQIDLSKAEKLYRKFYGNIGFSLDDYSLKYETPTYIYGLENAKNYISSNKLKKQHNGHNPS